MIRELEWLTSKANKKTIKKYTSLSLSGSFAGEEEMRCLIFDSILLIESFFWLWIFSILGSILTFAWRILFSLRRFVVSARNFVVFFLFKSNLSFSSLFIFYLRFDSILTKSQASTLFLHLKSLLLFWVPIPYCRLCLISISKRCQSLLVKT